MISCSKPKTSFICGDHICVNKDEAKQYFEENLTIEVQIFEKNNSQEKNLVQLNLNENFETKRKISVYQKNKTNKDLKVLSNDEIIKIKKKIKSKNKDKKIVKKIITKNEDPVLEKKVKKNKMIKNVINQNNVSKINNDIVDVCTILEKCSIEEISKYLLEKGNKKDFPDITKRQ